MYLSAVLKKADHTVDLLIESGEKDPLAQVKTFNPDLVGMYCTTGDHVWALDFAQKIKSVSSAKVILGGPHPTFFPEIIEHEAIDLVCRGEGERSVATLLERLSSGQPYHDIPGLWAKSNGTIYRNQLDQLITDLDALPLPDRSIYYDRYSLLRDNPSKHFITGRGCPFNCSFCCNKAYNELYAHAGPIIRRLSPERVIEDVLAVRENYTLKSVRFDDEVFLLKPSWLLNFLKLYQEKVAIPFTCLIRADLAREWNIKAMHEAGCYSAYFGVESGNDVLRTQVLKKSITRNHIYETAHYLRKYGIKIGTFNMVGIPGETIAQAFETVAINQRIKADYPWCSVVQPYPQTELLEIAHAAGLIDGDLTPENFSASYFNRSVIKNPDSKQLVNLHRLFYLAVKFPALVPLIKLLIKVPNNKLFDYVFSATFAHRYIKTYRVPFTRLVRAARHLKERF